MLYVWCLCQLCMWMYGWAVSYHLHPYSFSSSSSSLWLLSVARSGRWLSRSLKANLLVYQMQALINLVPPSKSLIDRDTQARALRRVENKNKRPLADCARFLI